MIVTAFAFIAIACFFVTSLAGLFGEEFRPRIDDSFTRTVIDAKIAGFSWLKTQLGIGK
jgi:hypothetical protein